MSDPETPVAVTLMQKLGAEALGTFVLVFAGAATALLSDYGLVATALAFGIAYIVMGYAVGHLSGGHFNPAVSVGAGVSGRMAWREVGRYAAAQLVGALAAGLALFAVLHGFEGFDAEGSMGQNFFGDQSPGEFAVWAALVVETLATFLFVTLFLSTTDSRNPHLALAPTMVGLSLALIHFATINMTGTSLNPARSIGVGLFAGGDAVIQLWLFILAPLLGAVGAGLLHPIVFGRAAAPVPGSGLSFSRPGSAGADAQQQWAAQWSEQGEEQEWQTEYPGWRWDPVAQEWVPDPTTAPPQEQQWSQETEGHQGATDDDDEATTRQFRAPE